MTTLQCVLIKRVYHEREHNFTAAGSFNGSRYDLSAMRCYDGPSSAFLESTANGQPVCMYAMSI